MVSTTETSVDPCRANTDLRALLERVKGAKKPDRELDFAIYCAALNAKQVGGESIVKEAWLPDYVYPHDVSRFTASLDSALALVERVLPRWRIGLHQRWQAGSWEAVLGLNYEGRADQGPHRVVSSTAPTPALALLAAILTAKLMQDDAATKRAT